MISITRYFHCCCYIDTGPLRPPRLVAEALVTKAIPAKLSSILVTHTQTVREDGKARTPEERSSQVIHSFQVDLVPSLERVMMIRLEPDGRVLLMQSLFSVQINVYSNQKFFFACLGKFPAKGLAPAVEILDKAFVAWRSIHHVPLVNHVSVRAR